MFFYDALDLIWFADGQVDQRTNPETENSAKIAAVQPDLWPGMAGLN
jgi:hypothetical protein